MTNTDNNPGPGRLARMASKATLTPLSELCGHHDEFERRIACIDRGNHDHGPADASVFPDQPTAEAISAEAEFEQRVSALKNWWLEAAKTDVDMVAHKAVEYGSNSLTQVGRKMAQLSGREVTEEEAQELGCWSYAIGKLERWTDAVMRGDRPSDDTLVDLIAYAMMTRRLREVGTWPGV